MMHFPLKAPAADTHKTGGGGVVCNGYVKNLYQMSSLTLDIGARRRGIIRLFVLKGMCKSFKLDK